jgi:hypothetical protein
MAYHHQHAAADCDVAVVVAVEKRPTERPPG